jgi:hypothetical protein
MKKIHITLFVLFFVIAGVKTYANESEYSQVIMALQSVSIADDGWLEIRVRYPDKLTERTQLDGEEEFHFFIKPSAIGVKIDNSFSGTAMYILDYESEWWDDLRESNKEAVRELTFINFATVIVQTKQELEIWEEFVQSSKHVYEEINGEESNFKKVIPPTQN